MRKYLLGLIIIWVMIISAVIFAGDIPSKRYDLVIKHGRILNPATKLDQTGVNIGVNAAKIAIITQEPIRGKTDIDATGLVVVPGFIDLLSYNPNWEGVWNKLADGITTNIGMHGAIIDPNQWFSFYDKQHLPLHYGGSFFYTLARMKLGLGRYQSANQAQIKQLSLMGEFAIQKGCLGISMSLEYVPGISPEECLSMMKLAHKYNVGVYYHVRYSTMEGPGTNLDALNEVIGYAKATGAAIHIDHINSTGGTYSMKESLALLEKARAEGVDVTACAYPYNYWATYLNSARFDPGWQTRFHISYQDLQLGGSSERLTAESFEFYRKQGKLANAFAIPEEDLRDALRCPWVMMGSDGILEPGFNNHPRASGMCARLIGHYVRDEKVLSLMDAIAKLTILPAKRLESQCPALRSKGRLEVGADADITIFDYDQIMDQATPEHPEYQSTGVEYVLVGGEIVKTPRGFYMAYNGKGIKSEFITAKPVKEDYVFNNNIKIPVIEYHHKKYINLKALQWMGFELQKAPGDREIFIQKAASPIEKAGLNLPALAKDEPVLERGVVARFQHQNVNLISIGEELYYPLTGLNVLELR